MRSRAYRAQIAEFRQLLAEFPNQVDEVHDGNVRGHLIKLMELLHMHFKMEEQYIYPEMLKHADPEVRALIEEFRDDLPPIVAEFDTFYATWSHPGAVAANAKTFLGDWANVKITLAARLDREERELFAAFDRAS
jgi:hypothetical protein